MRNKRGLRLFPDHATNGAWQSRFGPLTAALPRPHSAFRAIGHPLRRGGREVECAALEMRFTGNRNVGSNPTLSATSRSEAFQ